MDTTGQPYAKKRSYRVTACAVVERRTGGMPAGKSAYHGLARAPCYESPAGERWCPIQTNAPTAAQISTMTHSCGHANPEGLPGM